MASLFIGMTATWRQVVDVHLQSKVTRSAGEAHCYNSPQSRGGGGGGVGVVLLCMYISECTFTHVIEGPSSLATMICENVCLFLCPSSESYDLIPA